MIKLNLKNTIDAIDFDAYKEKVASVHRVIHERTGAGNDYLGWTNWPSSYDKEEFARIKTAAQYIRSHFDILVVCGIGGSYLGARSAIEALNGLFKKDKLEIIYFGQTFSPNYIAQVMDYLHGKNFAINVISKSGTTTETSISFRLVKELLEKQIGKENAKKAIFATTDKARGALKTLCDQEGYETFVLPDDIGGRYSLLTPVGLLPIACAGVDIDALMEGALKAEQELNEADLDLNQAYKYAVVRDHFYRQGRAVELYVTYEPHLTQIGEWLKQLFGESEGKEKKGLLPDSVTFSTDLHSLGQFIQDGSPVLFETVLYVEKPNRDIKVPHDKDDLDGLNYLEGKTLSFVNEKAFLGTLDAHVKDGRVPNIIIKVPEMNPYNLGYLFYFFMKTCAMSAYLLEINPFNQPGVEIYKRNMFHLLGKKGY